MRGSPLLIAGLTLGFFVLLLAPLRHLTGARTPLAGAAPAAASPDTAAPRTDGAAPSAVQLEITSTRAPFTFEVRHLGKVVWTGELASGTSRAHREVSMEFPPEGVDLQLRGRWTDAGGTTPSAVRLTVTTPDGTVRERMVMAEAAALDETLTFP